MCRNGKAIGRLSDELCKPISRGSTRHGLCAGRLREERRPPIRNAIGDTARMRAIPRREISRAASHADAWT
jgi:hypothetical protein